MSERRYVIKDIGLQHPIRWCGPLGCWVLNIEEAMLFQKYKRAMSYVHEQYNPRLDCFDIRIVPVDVETRIVYTEHFIP